TSLSLPHPHAERGEAVAAVSASQLVQQRHDQTRAAHAEGMAECDRAAVHVHALRVEPELADHDQALRGDRLVQLDEVELAGLASYALQQPADRRYRADAHHARIDPGDRGAA